MNDSAHWLEGVLLKAGTTAGGADVLPNSLSLAEAWEKASSATGIHQNELADLVAAFFHLPRADLLEVEGKALKLVPEALAKKYHLLPLHEDYRRLVVATADPTNLEAEQSLGFASGRGISLVVASYSEIETAFFSHYSPDKDVARILFQVQPGLDSTLDDFRVIEDDENTAPSLEEAGSGPLVNLTNVVLKEAVESGASDIHLQPMAHGGVIRYRIDGVLRNSGNMPLSVLTRVVSRIKIMAKLDIADRLRPQDGRAKVGVGTRTVDLRSSHNSSIF
jgi:type IV pilus assembly protein PilB